MDPNVLLPLLSSLVSFVFAALVFGQWLARRRAFQLVWTIGLLWYGISAGTEFWGSAFGWNEPLYRAWYLFGAFFVAAYLGQGTVYLLSRTRFGYFVAASVLGGGVFALLLRQRYEAPETGLAVFGVTVVVAIAIAFTTARYREWSGHVAMALLLIASVYVAPIVLTVPLGSPGFALDPATGVPNGDAFPRHVRIFPGPFNIAGAFTLVFGALFSAYVFMPKRKVLRGRALPPVLAQLYGAVAVMVNLVVSLPGAFAALGRGQLHSRVPATLLIALGGFIPGITSGLNRFGITWAFFLGELLGVVLILAGFLISTEVFATKLRVGRVELLRRGPVSSS